MASERLPWICKDPASQRLFELAERVAPIPATVLITGESGTGKDYLARLIHELGTRRDTPFIKIECESLPPPLLESELFGHERGAFPGAAERKLGRFELDAKSTIVLDEVAGLTASTQARLLRAMEERVFERLGGKEHLRAEARIIALTSADLAVALKQGRFREDLYYRLDLVKIWLPPLRERRADILALAEHLLVGMGAAHRRPKIRLSDGAKGVLEKYRWPGNVRELRDTLKGAMSCGQGEMLEAEHLPAHIRANLDGNRPEAGSRSLEDVEREAIEATLKATHNQIGRSAKILGISRKTLLEKRKKYGWIEFREK
ncbi:MAG: sigma 54-interacting transcriptional regulator [Candidatus Acidiferrales bacterium]